MDHMKEVRGLKEAFISFQERIDYLEFENSVLIKENRVLKSKFECSQEKLNAAIQGSQVPTETNIDLKHERDAAVAEMQHYKVLYERE
jgi:hypothetical protein